MLATILAAISALEQILFCKDDVAFFRIVKVVWV